MARLDSASNFNGKISLVLTLQIRSAVCGLCRCNNEVTGGAIGESEESGLRNDPLVVVETGQC